MRRRAAGRHRRAAGARPGRRGRRAAPDLRADGPGDRRSTSGAVMLVLGHAEPQALRAAGRRDAGARRAAGPVRCAINESGRPAHVVDAGIEQTRTGDWVLSRLAVQEPGRLGRRGQLHQLAWDEVDGPGAAAGRAGRRDADRHLPRAQRRRPRARAAGAADQAAARGRRGAGRRAAGRRARRAARGRADHHPGHARRRAGPPTSSRRWTPTTPPTCWPSSPTSTATGCSS